MFFLYKIITAMKNDKQSDQKELQKKIPTVTPDNDNGKSGSKEKQDTSNKDKGPKGENL